LYDIPGRGICTLGDRDIDRAFPIDQGIAGGYVSPEADGGDIPQVDSRTAAKL